MHVGLVAQKDNGRAAFLAAELRRRLREADVTVAVDTTTAETLDVEGTPIEAFDDCDLVVSIGGDGTFLFAARGADGTPILGVNLGEVGFLNAVGPEEAVDVVLDEVAAFRAGELTVHEAPRLAASGDGWTAPPTTNEVVVQGSIRGPGGGVDIEVSVDGKRYSDGHADGLLVATPTGSTAYNLSESGPLVHPGVDAIVVNEMCASDGMPPLVVGPDSTVSVTVSGADRAVVVGDGRVLQELAPPAEVSVARADSPMRVAGPAADFFEALGKLD
ncbi:NAD(+)/NADH kinase [Haloplanus rallus]|uniref:NAD kinase n=1 Tax=Haloplanus rallus TaxID=1816183 RepID=A0A6B9F6L3_9EURY|nr:MULTISPECIES: NAD(+)/NADH kinase [Haloplanus]QGX96166.1 NAD(+)/NADH kinase [Haloplanus rallus]